ncbi:MAG: hypothetical protein HYR85_09920 [Planctomycetes bacterium]|nr:hypothetical protein [Planctomycetota bacterium]
MNADLPADYRKPTVKLVGTDGNALSILGRVSAAMKEAGIPKETIDAFFREATAGDYDHLLRVVMTYAEVE